MHPRALMCLCVGVVLAAAPLIGADEPTDLELAIRGIEAKQASGKKAEMIASLGEMAASVSKVPGREPWVERMLPFAQALFREHDLDGAGKAYLAMMKHLPDSPKIIAGYGVVLMSKGDLDGASEHFERALALSPADPMILGNVAEAAIFKKDFTRAKTMLHRRIGVLPKDTAAAFDVAIVTMEDNPKASLSHWMAYREKARHQPDSHWGGVAEKIIEMLQRGIAPDQIRDLAMEFNRAKVSKYAIPLLIHLEKNQPTYALYPYLLAESYEAANMPSYAVRELERTRNLLTALPAAGIRMEDVRLALARNRLALGQSAGALEELKAIESSDPKYPKLLYFMALSYRMSGDEASARTYLENCAKTESSKELRSECQTALAEKTGAPGSK